MPHECFFRVEFHVNAFVLEGCLFRMSKRTWTSIGIMVVCPFFFAACSHASPVHTALYVATEDDISSQVTWPAFSVRRLPPRLCVL